MTRIYLRAGHGGAYTGTSGNGLVEKHEALRQILSIAGLLSNYNVELKLARTTDITVNLSTSIKEANEWEADLYYSAHINGYSDKQAYGYESYVYSSPSAESIRVQKEIHSRQADVWIRWGSRDRGRKRANFAELRETTMAAILVENGFITNNNDSHLLKNNIFLSELAEATIMGFVSLYGLKKTKEPEVNTHMYIVQPGDTLHSIAHNNSMTLEQLADLNPHIRDAETIETGDMIFSKQPSLFEEEYASLNHEFILCKKKLKEYQEIGLQINTLTKKLI